MNPRDILPLLLKYIPEEPSSIDTSALRALLSQQGIPRTARSVQIALMQQVGEGIDQLKCNQKTKPFQWSKRRGSSLGTLLPDAHTAIALKMAFEHLGRVMPEAFVGYFRKYLRGAEATLSRANPTLLKSWYERVRVIAPGILSKPVKITPEVLSAVLQATIEGRRVKLLYTPRNATESKTYVVDPAGLVARGGVIELVGFYGKKAEPRRFVLHRAKSAETLTAKATIDPGFHIDRYLESGGDGFVLGDAPLALRLRVSAAVAQTFLERPLGLDQKLTPVGASFADLSATVRDNLELRAWLMSYGPEVEVLAPPELREYFVSEARALARTYGLLPSENQPSRPPPEMDDVRKKVERARKRVAKG